MGRQSGERPQGLGRDECHCDVPNDNSITNIGDNDISLNTSCNKNNILSNIHRLFNSHD